MSDILWDLFQNRRIRANADAAAGAQRRAVSASHTVRGLEAEVDRLNLICHSMWELLEESIGVTEDQLVRKVREVDLRSGRLDGKAPSAPVTCPSCERTVHARHTSCLYCGTQLSTSPFPK